MPANALVRVEPRRAEAEAVPVIAGLTQAITTSLLDRTGCFDWECHPFRRGCMQRRWRNCCHRHRDTADGFPEWPTACGRMPRPFSAAFDGGRDISALRPMRTVRLYAWRLGRP